ncbi:MAG: preprotein translocase subunit SecG [Treponema sp.]|jgi:preprotein translocase subunit SecG|nr:preprotein translocase subunit SecG [Treponema sp.]
MGILGILLLILFIIVAVLLILIVLVQNEEGDSLGGIFAGGSGSAFGSRSGNVLTKTTTILGAVFLILSLGLALINKTPGGEGVESAARELTTEEEGEWWKEDSAGAENAVPGPDAGLSE